VTVSCPIHKSEHKLVVEQSLPGSPWIVNPCPGGCLPEELMRLVGLNGHARAPEWWTRARERITVARFGTAQAGTYYLRVTAALFAQGYAGRRSDIDGVRGEGRYSFPACGERGDGKSLHVSVGTKGQPVVLHCHANRCQPNEILAALELTWADISRPLPEISEFTYSVPDGEKDEKSEKATEEDPRPILDWHELWKQEAGEDWIVEPLIAARRGVVIYSRAKLGKSLLMLEIAVAVANGTQVLGVKIDRPRRVLYVDFEKDPQGDIRPRLEDMGYGPEDLGNLCYQSFPDLAYLDSEQGGQELFADAQRFQCEIVVIDTVSRTVQGKENENDTWLDFYRHTGKKLKQAKIACLRLDHPGKDESRGMRGGSAKAGDVDAVWRLSEVVRDQTFRLDLEYKRMRVMEQTLTLHRETEPKLRHRVDARGRAGAFDAKVDELVRLCDEHELPNDANRDDARGVATANSVKAGTDVIRKVVKIRKARGGYVDDV
jgi:hypothetical protein